MNQWETFGHQNIKAILNKQLKNQNFPHAYLFFGPEGVGKNTLAMEFARKILGTENLNTHPDFSLLEDAGEITVEHVQAFLPQLAFKPFVANKKVAIINNAENLNKTAANAILKTLEEPSESTILILVASSASLLPTIVSRCQVFNFALFGLTQLTEMAVQLNRGLTSELLRLCFGRSSRLIKLTSNRDFLESETQKANQFSGLKQMTMADKFLLLGELAGLENPDLTELLTCWTNLQILELKQVPKNFIKVQALIEGVKGLKQNFNKKLVLQGLMQKI